MEALVLPEATGGNGALAYRLTSAPAGLAGLSFDPAARRLSGTPTTEGSHVFTWRAEDADENRADSDAAVLTFGVTVEDPRTALLRKTMKRTLAAVARRALSSALENIGARFASLDSGLGPDPGRRDRAVRRSQDAGLDRDARPGRCRGPQRSVGAWWCAGSERDAGSERCVGPQRSGRPWRCAGD